MKLIIDKKELETIYKTLYDKYEADYAEANERQNNLEKAFAIGKSGGLIDLFSEIIRIAEFCLDDSKGDEQ